MQQNPNSGLFTGERALFASRNLTVCDSVFRDGESPLKESKNIEVISSSFEWKYPLWYCENVSVTGSTLKETARSGIWYTKNIEITDTLIEAPKTFRRAEKIRLSHVQIPNAEETMWYCKDIRLCDVEITGDYFGLSAKDVYAENLKVDGNYIFDGAENVEIRGAVLMSKDAFWNCKNVTVYDSLIVGEYLGWNSENVRLVNCTVESNQGMCYMEGLVLENCILRNTDLAFEYSSVDAEIKSAVDSVKNPKSGIIRAENIGEVILEKEFVNTEKTKILITK